MVRTRTVWGGSKLTNPVVKPILGMGLSFKRGADAVFGLLGMVWVVVDGARDDKRLRMLNNKDEDSLSFLA